MRKGILKIVALALVASVGVAGIGNAQTPVNKLFEPHLSAFNKAIVVHEWVKHPHSERVVKKFVPTGAPSPEYVKDVIAPYEAHRYHTDSIWDRVWCESSGIYNNGNGTYSGLIATNEVYWYGGAWDSVVDDKDFNVRLKDKKRVKRKVFRVRLWDTGKKTYNHIGNQYVRRVVIEKGKLPKDATWMHGWAAVRVGTRAVAGVGPTTYWACAHNGSNY